MARREKFEVELSAVDRRLLKQIRDALTRQRPKGRLREIPEWEKDLLAGNYTEPRPMPYERVMEISVDVDPEVARKALGLD